MKTNILSTCILFFMTPSFLYGQSNIFFAKIEPQYIGFQYAGNVGLASIGIGYGLKNQKIYLGGIYGYLPKSINGVEVQTIAIKAYYIYRSKQIFKNTCSYHYFGSNINYGITKNTYLNYPDYFPKDYYKTNALHIAPFIGTKTEYSLSKSYCYLRKIAIYCELGTIDQYIFADITSKQINIFDIVNICTGITFNIGKSF